MNPSHEPTLLTATEFTDRVMAAISLTPMPTPTRTFVAALRTRAVRDAVAALWVAWHLGTVRSWHIAPRVRARSFALVLAVASVLATGSLAAAATAVHVVAPQRDERTPASVPGGSSFDGGPAGSGPTATDGPHETNDDPSPTTSEGPEATDHGGGGTTIDKAAGADDGDAVTKDDRPEATDDHDVNHGSGDGNEDGVDGPSATDDHDGSDDGDGPAATNDPGDAHDGSDDGDAPEATDEPDGSSDGGAGPAPTDDHGDASSGGDEPDESAGDGSGG